MAIETIQSCIMMKMNGVLDGDGFASRHLRWPLTPCVCVCVYVCSGPGQSSGAQSIHNPKFKEWVEKLAEKGYFNGAEEGSEEYAARLAKAEAKWVEKYGKDEQGADAAMGMGMGMAIDAEAAEACKAMGNACVARADYREAISHYSDAIRHNPDNAVYFANRYTQY